MAVYRGIDTAPLEERCRSEGGAGRVIDAVEPDCTTRLAYRSTKQAMAIALLRTLTIGADLRILVRKDSRVNSRADCVVRRLDSARWRSCATTCIGESLNISVRRRAGSGVDGNERWNSDKNERVEQPLKHITG